MTQREVADKSLNMELANIKRNPYLAEGSIHSRRRRTASGAVIVQMPDNTHGGMRRQSMHAAGARSRQDSGRARQSRAVRQDSAAWQNNSTRQGSATRQGRAVRQGSATRQKTAICREYNGRSNSTVLQVKRRRNLKRIQMLKRLVCGGAILCVLLLTVIMIMQTFDKPQIDGSRNYIQEEPPAVLGGTVQGIGRSAYLQHPEWKEDFLTPNEYSRPGDALTTVNSIFVHYTANRNTSAAQNRSYFEQLKDTGERSASAHFIIGYEGEIIQCIPLDEIAYAVQSRNEDSISIECCFTAEDGSFTQETYDSLIALLGWLTDTYRLDTEDILRHYDCGGKKCPVYYVENEDAWQNLLKDVETL